ncbi:glycosyltransferase [Pedobacter foliorum]|uniref:glycosyltransferase n=1 Tax=Pedobacter foliorum TaxID=2739058 RepID=UPI001C26BA18|nr:glycosyltransferase [Pedobacter foliorum]
MNKYKDIMRILQLTKHYPPYFGGIESVTYDLTEGLNKSGIICDVLCCNDKNVEKINKIDNYLIKRTASFGKLFSTSISPSLIFSLKNCWRKYDIIHVHCPDPLTTLALFLVRPKSKIIVHWHSDIVKQKYLLKLFIPLQNWLLKRADAIIGTTDFYIKYSPQLAKFLNKTVCIPIGISGKIMNASEDKVKVIQSQYSNKKIVFTLGRLIYYKGFEYLIEASKYLPDDFVVLIGGAGVLKISLQSQIDRYGLSERVKLIGRIKDEELGDYFAASNIFCLPSVERSEAFGVVLLEAMQMGKPVIATEIEGSGVSWVNQHGVTGYNVPVRDPEALAQKIIAILSDEDLCRQFSVNSKKRFLNYFTADKMVTEVLKLYQSLMI